MTKLLKYSYLIVPAFFISCTIYGSIIYIFTGINPFPDADWYRWMTLVGMSILSLIPVPFLQFIN